MHHLANIGLQVLKRNAVDLGHLVCELPDVVHSSPALVTPQIRRAIATDMAELEVGLHMLFG